MSRVLISIMDLPQIRDFIGNCPSVSKYYHFKISREKVLYFQIFHIF